MSRVVLYTRAGCHLCEAALDWLKEIQDFQTFDLEIVDIDLSPELSKRFWDRIPVVEIGGYTFKYPFTKDDLKLAILVSTKSQKNEKRNPNFALKILTWVDRHWLFVANGFFSLFLLGAFVPPIFMKIGLESAARWGYSFFGFFCHQLGFRSFYLFGYQYFYPRQIAGVTNADNFGTATGLSEVDLFAARAHLGDSFMGYKIALCERDLAMYAGLVIFGFIFVLLRDKIKGLPLWAWILFAVIPVGLDGGLQLLSQLPILRIQEFLPARESTPILRTLTGFIFGFGTAWFAYPIIQTGASSKNETI